MFFVLPSIGLRFQWHHTFATATVRAETNCKLKPKTYIEYAPLFIGGHIFDKFNLLKLFQLFHFSECDGFLGDGVARQASVLDALQPVHPTFQEFIVGGAAYTDIVQELLSALPYLIEERPGILSIQGGNGLWANNAVGFHSEHLLGE